MVKPQAINLFPTIPSWLEAINLDRLENKQLVGSDKAIPLPSELHELGDRTFWHPYYWSAFTLIGNP